MPVLGLKVALIHAGAETVLKSFCVNV